MHRSPALPACVALAMLLVPPSRAAEDREIRWLVEFDGKDVPAAAIWKAHSSPEATATPEGLRLADASTEGDRFYRAAWKPEPGTEVVVEATLRVVKTTGALATKPESRTLWPWRDGAPVSLLVSDGRHHEGIVFYSDRVTTWTDRFIIADTTDGFHTYRAVIRDTDMSIAIDGEAKVRGQNAFWKPAPTGEAFIQFGSNAKRPTGEAVWRSVRLGVRKAAAAPPPPPVKVTLSEPWPITRPGLAHKHTRPYVYRVGEGQLLMSVAQGPDASWEPYGVMRSNDDGKTWTPVAEWDQCVSAPLPMRRLRDGSVIGMSRWTWPVTPGEMVGSTTRWSADLGTFTAFPSRILYPPQYFTRSVPLVVERAVFENADGSIEMTAYSKTGPKTPEGARTGGRWSHLLRSTDGGKAWNHVAVIGAGGEPAVAQTGGGRMTAILRVGPFKPFHQTFSEDHGRTWSAPVLLEEGSVCADLVQMSNGLLACSYGRPANSLMFSADGGRTWSSHHVITDRTGFNYSGIVEVRPGRLLYVHDAGGLQALTIDVERVNP